ncbi:IS66 family insertion sequence element accessory protein TnpA [Sorangium sp. So ce302]|uniref:IS66 family insertion sequence element accessory protein TnpA n=1 Tax=Sorangium sp. So ce302 TaxID=3133297 RepID=UPI003F646061
MMACMTRTKATEVMWSERVRAWRERGETAEAFARSRGFAASTLHGWSSRLSRTERPRFLRLVPKAPAVTSSASELVVEVGGARVRVAAGFDAALLADVVRALGGGAR